MEQPKVVIVRLSRRTETEPEPEHVDQTEEERLSEINDILANLGLVTREDPEELPKEPELDNVRVDVPNGAGGVTPRYVHPDVKALINELMGTTAQLRTVLEIAQDLINNAVEEQ